MQAGCISLKCLLQQPGTGEDELGQPIPNDWVTIAEPWCDPVSQSGIESIRAGADTSVVKVSMGMRARAGVTAAMRLVGKYSGTVYQIEAVLPDNRDRSRMFLVCKVVS